MILTSSIYKEPILWFKEVHLYEVRTEFIFKGGTPLLSDIISNARTNYMTTGYLSYPQRSELCLAASM